MRNIPDPFAILFEPVAIGPVTAKNRFFQVPHCNGMGYRDPTALAVMRGIKAEGGWAVVCTEQAEIHPSSEITPFIELRLWDDGDIPMLARMAEHVQRHGALAGIELVYNGMHGANHYSREVPMSPSALPVDTFYCDPVQARSMDREDIKNLRRWHVNAAKRAKKAGYDIVYAYAAHKLSILQHFMLSERNSRSDEYGGSPANRIRLLGEVISDMKNAVGDACAIACRISPDALIKAGLERAEMEDMAGSIGDLPDLWDVVMSGWENDSVTSRFAPEGHEEELITAFRKLTGKPLVGVGRYTSPDRMAALVRRGVMDFIGCARPSIADPFMPVKIAEGRADEIRECIGCNICVSGDFTMSPIRCTQNSSMGEEWRKGWHPERIRRRESEKPVLVAGAGPAGLEAAMWLGRRGYRVVLAEKEREAGGRVRLESRLPGLAAWRRVIEYRMHQLSRLDNVEMYLESEVTPELALELGLPRIVVATGAKWRRDGVGRARTAPLAVKAGAELLTPDDIMAGRRPAGRSVLIWDDDHYYMGGVIASLLAGEGFATHYVTTASEASTWTRNTLEQHRIQRELLEKGVTITAFRSVAQVAAGHVSLRCVHTGKMEDVAAEAFVPVTSRISCDKLAQDIKARHAEFAAAAIESVTALGDALAPAAIAHATYAGRRYAEELDVPPRSPDEVPFLREARP